MAFFKIDNVKIAGISACVPPKQVENIDSILIEDKKELEKYIETTGVKRRYIAEEGICSSDLCLEAAERLIEKLDCCLLYTSDAADEQRGVDIGGRRTIYKKKKEIKHRRGVVDSMAERK